jgi:hypothetical protein
MLAMPMVRYRCPTVGKLAEVWTEGKDEEELGPHAYFDSVYCNACGGVHLVDPRTGRVAGEDE